MKKAPKTQTTTDHAVIQAWVEERGGGPARAKGVNDRRAELLLRIDLGEPDEELEKVSWDQFFKIFEEKGLAFLFQDEVAGKKSRFYKFIRREEADIADEEAEERGSGYGGKKGLGDEDEEIIEDLDEPDEEEQEDGNSGL